MAKKLRSKRVAAGAMMNTKIKMSFKLNESGQPTDCEPYNRTESNMLVEEVCFDFPHKHAAYRS